MSVDDRAAVLTDEGTSAEDYVHSEVPADATVSGLHLALVIIGGTIGFSIFIVASQIGGALGYGRALGAFTLGRLVLGVMGALTSYVGARSRLSTYLLTEFAFGQGGAKLVNLAVAMSLIGWYGVISNFLGQAGQQMLLEATGVEVATYIPVVIASLLMIGVTLLGFTGIDKLALYLVPVMIGFLIYAAITSLGASTPANSLSGDFTFETAVSAVVGSYIAGVIIQPDYSRFANSLKGAVWSVFLALGIAFPAVQFLSAIPSLATGNANLMAVMALLGLTLPAFLLLVLGAWSSNVLCLYSAGLSIATVADKISLRKIISGVGIIGTAIAFVPAQDYLIDFLVVLGVVIPPIGAVYLIDAFLLRRFDYAASHQVGGKAAWVNPKAFIAWGCGSLAGFMVQLGYGQISGISSVDSLLVTALVLMLMEHRSILRWSC